MQPVSILAHSYGSGPRPWRLKSSSWKKWGGESEDGQSECEPQQEDLELCWGSPRHSWYQLDRTHLHWGKEAFSCVRSAFPLNGDHVGGNGKVRESIWNERAVNPHLLPWKRKWQNIDQWFSNCGLRKYKNG